MNTKIVTLMGMNKRGKDRVNNFGVDGKFALKDRNDDKILVEALVSNFRIGNRKVPWSGWLEVGKEVQIVNAVEEKLT